MNIIGRTDAGLVRDSNQDSFSVVEFSDKAAAVIVCDGMGGANGGSVASETAVKVIADRLTSDFREDMSPKALKATIESAVYAANIAIFEMAQANKELFGMGTTVIAMVLSNSVAYIAHIGDSRVYLLNNENELTQITRDHSIVQQMIESGKLTVEEAMVHPKRNVITRALGVSESIDIDYNEIEVNPGEKVLLCTDGLVNYLSHDEMVEIINTSDRNKCSENLIEAANKNGGGDNITVVVVSD